MEFLDLNLKNYPMTEDKSIPQGLYFLIAYAVLLNYAKNKYDDLDLSYDENSQTLKITTKRGIIASKNFLNNFAQYTNWTLANAISVLTFNDVNITFSTNEAIYKVIVKDKEDLTEKIPAIFISKQDINPTNNWISLRNFNEENAFNDTLGNGTTITLRPISILDLQTIKPSFSFLQAYQAIINTSNHKLLIPKENELTSIFLNGVWHREHEVGNQDLNGVHLIYGYDFDMHQQYLNNTQSDFNTNGSIMAEILGELSIEDQRKYYPAIFNNEQSYEWSSRMVQGLVTITMNKFYPNQYLIYKDDEYHDFFEIAKKAGKTLVKVRADAYSYLVDHGIKTLYYFVQEYMNEQYSPAKNEIRNLNFEERSNLKTLSYFIDNFANNYPELKAAWKKQDFNRLYLAVFSAYPNQYGTYWPENRIGIINRKNLINMNDLLIAGKEIVYASCNLPKDQFDNKWLDATITYFMNKCNDLKSAIKNNKKWVQKKKPS